LQLIKIPALQPGVVLHWRTTHSSFVVMPYVHCNQYYSGLYPTANNTWSETVII